jgi:hypothetical protein
MIIPGHNRVFFHSHEEQRRFRTAAFKMCRIKPVPPSAPSSGSTNTASGAQPTLRPVIVFLDRLRTRLISNTRKLCRDLYKRSHGVTATERFSFAAPPLVLSTHEGQRSNAFEIWRLPADGPSICEKARIMDTADVIVTIHGSQNLVLLFARPHVSVVLAYPFHHYMPDFKAFAHLSSLHVVEEITTDRANFRTNRYKKAVPEVVLETSHERCVTNFYCALGPSHHDVHIPRRRFRILVDRALELWRNHSK